MTEPLLVEATRRTRKLRETRAAERKVVKAFRAKWTAEQRAVLRTLTRHKARFGTEAVRDSRFMVRESLVDDVMASLNKAVGTGDRTAARQLWAAVQPTITAGVAVAASNLNRKTPDSDWAEAAGYAKTYGADRVTDINDTTRGYLRAAIARAVSKGTSHRTLARDIAGMYREWRTARGRSRAELIAITEIGEAYEAGSDAFYDHAETEHELRLEKSWLYVDDDRVSKQICKPNGQQGWIPRAEAFQSGHMRPLGHPGCRCSQAVRNVLN